MTRTEAALLAAVAADPADDTPRLVYADWLDENGRPEQAEFVRVQVEMGRIVPEPEGYPDPESPDLERFLKLRTRASELAKVGGPAWFARLQELAGEFETHRGFPYSIALDARRFLAHAAEIFRVAPTVTDMMVTRLGKNTPALAACEELAHIHTLTFFETPFRRREMEQLAASPHLGNLRCFAIPHTDTTIGPEGASALADARSITALEELDLGGQAVFNHGVYELMRARWVGPLRVLDLRNNGLTDEAAQEIAEAGLGRLRRLNLMNNHLGPHGARFVAGSPSLAGLERLDLSLNSIGDDGARAVVGSPHLRNLEELDLAFCDLSPAGCAAVFADAPPVRTLNLGGNAIFRTAFLALRAAPHYARLRNLRLDRASLVEDSSAALGAVDSLSALRTLSLRTNPLGPEGVRALLAGPLVSTVTWLDLDRCQLGDAGAAAVAASPAVVNLTHLSLWDNGITSKGAKALADSPHLNSLRSVSLNANRIDKLGRDALVERFGEGNCWF